MPTSSLQKVLFPLMLVNVLIMCGVYIMRNGLWKPQPYFVREAPQSCLTLWGPAVEAEPLPRINLTGYYTGNACLYNKQWKHSKDIVQNDLNQIQKYVKRVKKDHVTSEEFNAHLLKLTPSVETGQFQPIDTTGGYVVSAFLDHRVEPSPDVKVLYIVPLTSPHLYCQTVCNGVYINVHGSPEFLYFYDLAHERCIWNQYVLHCHFPVECDLTHISITSSPCRQPTNLLRITNTDAHYKPPGMLGACLNHMYNLTTKHIPQVINFFETFLYFGGDVVYLYSHSNLDAELTMVLQHYVKKGLLHMYNWTIPADVSSLFYFAQVLQNMDCAYRHTQQVQHLLFLDLDEALYPIQHSSYQQLLNHIKLNTFTKYTAGMYLPRVNTYLPLEVYPPIHNHSHPKKASKDLFCTELHYKPLIRPRNILTLGVHTIELTLRPFHHGAVLSRDMAAVFHIRDHEIACTADSIIDQMEIKSMNISLTKWYPKIKSRAEKVMKVIHDGF